MLKKILIQLLLGRSREYVDLVKINGDWYDVRIYPYESVEDLLDRATNSGVFMAQEIKK